MYIQKATTLTTQPPWPVTNFSFVTSIFFWNLLDNKIDFLKSMLEKAGRCNWILFGKKAIEAFLHIPSNMQIKFLFPTNISCKLLSSAIFKFVFEGIAFHKMAFQCFWFGGESSSWKHEEDGMCVGIRYVCMMSTLQPVETYNTEHPIAGQDVQHHLTFCCAPCPLPYYKI